MSAPTDDFLDHILARAKAAGATAAQALSIRTRYFEIEFDHRSIELVRSTENETTTITLFYDGKRGGATLNGRRPEEVEAAIAAAATAAEAGVADPANDIADAPSLPPGDHGPREPDRAAMRRQIDELLASLPARHPLLRLRDCLYAFTDRETEFANSRGLRQRERRSEHGFRALFMAKDGPLTTSFNFVGASAFSPFPSLYEAAGVDRLMAECERSLERRPVAGKFVGDVIVTPHCLTGLLPSIAGALSGPALLAGSSPFKDKRGERIASPLFSLDNAPRSADFSEGSDFDEFGVPTRDLPIIENGVLKDFYVGYFFSRKLGLPQTAGVRNSRVRPGETSLSDMIAGVKRGILFSRFSGGAPNDNLDFSGIAKNSFYIENGELRHALNETMVSGNFQQLLQDVHAVSKEVVNFGDCAYPFIAASGVTISSK
ncbi:TldD/PmbA family protein [Methylosinus sp. PW1]|uniref:TldD/PmbA family protein n=1 Tax=Methylosinus sp. PW1 TaxID=107636 RepID=UPI0005685BEE|nr:metallopeptidase TldD-related protein [Methylosinus sp. PW1]